MKKALNIVLLLFHLNVFISADSTAISYDSAVDWQKGTLIISLTVKLGKTEPLALARTKAEELAEQEIGGIFYEVLSRLILDSYRKIGDVSEKDPNVLTSLIGIGNRRMPLKIHMNVDLNTVVVQYSYDLFPTIMEVFTTHMVPHETKRILSFVPSVDYTGIVIFAKGEYPVHGENHGKESLTGLTPALKPRIYDNTMRLVASPEMVDPDALTKWGISGYSNSSDFSEHINRVGPFPLLTMARAVFGDNQTDLLIPEDAALEILSNTNNRELIRQGRILIICDLPSKQLSGRID